MVNEEKARLAAEKAAREDEAAIKLQCRVRQSQAQRELGARRAAARAAQDEAERQAATAVQAKQRANRANKQTGLLREERDMPPDQKLRRAFFASRISGGWHVKKAMAVRAALQAEKEALAREEYEAARAMQALLRVRKARQLKRRMREAAELGEVLGISKWAALWMLKEQEDLSKPAEEPEPEAGGAPPKAWALITGNTGSAPSTPKPSVLAEALGVRGGDDDDDEATRTAEASAPSPLQMERPQTAQGDGTADDLAQLLAELNDGAPAPPQHGVQEEDTVAAMRRRAAEERIAKREAEKAELARLEAERAAERARREAAAAARRRWKYVAENLKKALHVEYARMGINPKQDIGTRFAQLVQEKQARFQSFRSDHPNYPFGPLPAPPPKRGSTSPRRMLSKKDLVDRPKKEKDPMRAYGVREPARSGTAVGSRSEASLMLPARPATTAEASATTAAQPPPFGLDASLLEAPTLRSSISTIQLPPLENAEEYGLAASTASLPRRPQQQPTTTANATPRGAGLAPNPRQQPSLAWQTGEPPVALDSVGSSPHSIIDATGTSRPGSAAAARRAARGVPPPPLADGSVQVVRRFQEEKPSYPTNVNPLRATPSLPLLQRADSFQKLPAERPRVSLDPEGQSGPADAWATPASSVDRRSRGRPPARFESLPADPAPPPALVVPPRERSRSREPPPSRLAPGFDPDRPLTMGLRQSATTADLLRQSAPPPVLRPSTSDVGFEPLSQEMRTRFELHASGPPRPDAGPMPHVPLPTPKLKLAAGLSAADLRPGDKRPGTTPAFGVPETMMRSAELLQDRPETSAAVLQDDGAGYGEGTPAPARARRRRSPNASRKKDAERASDADDAAEEAPATAAKSKKDKGGPSKPTTPSVYKLFGFGK